MWQEPGTVEPWAAWTEQDGAPDLCPEPTAQCDVETAGPGAAGKSITGLGAVASLGPGPVCATGQPCLCGSIWKDAWTVPAAGCFYRNHSRNVLRLPGLAPGREK